MGENEQQDALRKTGEAKTAAPGEKTEHRPPRRRRRFIRILLISLVSVVVFLIAAVIYLTSERGFRRFIVPKMEKRMGRPITFDRLKIRPFHGAVIEGLTVGPSAGESWPLLRSNRLLVEWNPVAFLHRRVTLRKVAADGLRIFIVEQPNRPERVSSRRVKTTAEKKERPGAGEPIEPRLLVEDLHLTSASVEWIRLGPDRQSLLSRYAVRQLEVEGSQLGLGRPATLDLRARIEADDASQGVSLSDGRIHLQIASETGAGESSFTLAGSWFVDRLRGRFHGVAAEDLRATGSLEVEQSDPRLMAIRRADAVVFYQGRRGVDLSLAGELNPATGDGSARLRIVGINRDSLNLLSTPEQPLDFCDTVIGGRVTVEASDHRRRLAFESDLRITDFSVVASQISPAPTPPTQMNLQCKAICEKGQENLGLERLGLRAIQEGRDVVTVNLTSPITFSLRPGGTIATASSADLTVKIDNLRLSQFNPFLTPKKLRIETGALTADSALSVAAGGQSVAARGRIDFADLRALVSGSKTERTDIATVYDLALDRGTFSIKSLRCDVRSAGQPAGQIRGSGQIASGGQKGEIVLAGDRVDLSALQVFLAQASNVRFRAGRVSFSQKIAFAGSEVPIRFEGRFDGSDLDFDLPGRQRARFAGWAITGANLVRFDRTKQTADITSLSLTAEERAVGGLRAQGKGRMDFRQGAGLLNLDVEKADVPFLASVFGRFGAEASEDLRPTGGVIVGVAEVRFDKQFTDQALKGNLRTRGMRWTVSDGKTAQSSARDLEVSYDVAHLVSKGHRMLAIQELLIRVAGTGADGGSLRTNGRLDLTQNTGNLTVRFTRFDSEPVLSLVGPLIGAWRPISGVLDGQQEIKLEGRAGDISTNGKMRVQGLRVVAPTAKGPIAPPAIEVENTVALLQGGKAIRADRFVLRTFEKTGQSGSLIVSGQADLVQSMGKSSVGAGTLAISAENFETEAIWPILAALDIDLPIMGGRLNGKQDVHFALARATIGAKGTLRADEVRFRAASGATPLAPLTVALTNDFALDADKTEVRSLRLSTYSGGNALDQIEFSAHGGGLRSKNNMYVSLKSPTLHGDPYLAILSAVRSRSDKSKTQNPTIPGKVSTRPANAVGGHTSGFAVPPTQASIDIGKFYLRRLFMEKVAGTIDVTAEGVTVKSLTARLLDGSATATAWIRSDKNDMPYAGKVRGENLNVTSLLALVSPGAERKLTGKGRTTFEFSGRGFDNVSLRRDLHSSGSLQMRDGEMKEIPILNALASITRVETLADIRFFQIDGQWQMDGGVIRIPNALLVGKLQKLRARGQVDFDQKIDLVFDLWLGGELKDRLRDEKFLRYLVTESDRFLRLPVPIGMGGTLSKPRPTLNLPVKSIFDIGVEQGLKALQKYEEKRRK